VNTLSAASLAAGTPSRGPRYFADRLRDLRQRFVGKQLGLSYAVGCTIAAVSFWESGKRLPQRSTLSRILNALAREGASNDELTHLRASWKQAAITRSHRPSSDYAPDSTRTL